MARSTATIDHGSMLIGLIVAIAVLSVLMLAAVEVRETELQREMEEELIFRGHQITRAIELYVQKHSNQHPQSLEILHLEKFLRKLYKDPMTADGAWNFVFRMAGQEKMVVAPPARAGELFSRGLLVGVCSASPEMSFKIYRQKKRYNEWAFYVGGKDDADMPDLEFLGAK